MDYNLKEKMKQEAVRRMKVLEILPDVVGMFEKDGTICYSENMGAGFTGILFNFSKHPEWLDQVRKFEEENGYLVYHAALTHFTFGDVLDLLYVHDEEHEWEDELKELEQGYADIYGINLSDGWLSEFGSAKYEPRIGGIHKLQ